MEKQPTEYERLKIRRSLTSTGVGNIVTVVVVIIITVNKLE